MNEPHESDILLRRAVIDNARSVVVKVGTRVLTTAEGKLDRERIDALADQLCRIADTGRQVVMVSSGAVGAGVGKLGIPHRPTGLAELQAVAAIGQADLMQAYEKSFAARGRHAAQVLLTRADLRRRTAYLNVRNALAGIHSYGAIPVVNENDSVAVAELKTTFGDNDQLAAHVAGLLGDAVLIILSDVPGLYSGSPELPESKPIGLVRKLDRRVFALAADDRGEVSKGGMSSKLKAAQIATSHGHPTIIGPGREAGVLDRLFAGETLGTLFMPQRKAIRGRRRWISSAANVAGRLQLDRGAARAMTHGGSSLLAIGITAVVGSFPRGSVVALDAPDGTEIARGLCNYPSREIERILGHPSDEIESILGHRRYECVVHRNNLVLSVVPEHSDG